jgi:hypothetical protein
MVGVLHHAHSVIPHERLLNIDERFANAAAKPIIIPPLSSISASQL